MYQVLDLRKNNNLYIGLSVKDMSIDYEYTGNILPEVDKMRCTSLVTNNSSIVLGGSLQTDRLFSSKTIFQGTVLPPGGSIKSFSISSV